MNKISDLVLQDILQRCDITEVVSSYIPLKKAGRNFKAPCPFHHEKTPSFIVSPDKQIFHCFGCGAGGDVFSFVMKQERMEFPEAVRLLAERAGIEIVTETDQSLSGKSSVTAMLYRINELAAGYFHNNLLKSPRAAGAAAYLKERGLTRGSIEKFNLGYSFDSWDGLLGFLRSKDISDAGLLQSGLVIKNSQGRMYDRFRDRIMFPICNSQGKIIGFGGRVLENKDALKNIKMPAAAGEDSQPKYINSPETHIYSKSKNLYGFNLSKIGIQEKNYCIVVEGYLDCILPFQEGINNIVASLGTAFTADHVRILKRYTPNVVIVFDADTAGQEAALRSLDLLLQEGMNVKVASLETGFDPDTYVRRYGEVKFKEAVENADSLFDFKLNLLLKRLKKEIPEEKAQIADEMLNTICKSDNSILRSTYIRKLAERISVSEEVLLEELKKIKSPAEDFKAPAEYVKTAKITNIAEKMLLSLLFDDANLVDELKKVLHYDEFSDPLAQKIAKHIFDNNEEQSNPIKILNKLNDQQINLFMTDLLATDLGINDRQKSFQDCVIKIKKDKIQMRLKELQRQIHAGSSDEKKVKGLLHEHHRLKKELTTYEKGAKEKR